MLFAVRKTLVVQHFARFHSNLLCTDNNDFLTIYRHCASLLNNNVYYFIHVHAFFFFFFWGGGGGGFVVHSAVISNNFPFL